VSGFTQGHPLGWLSVNPQEAIAMTNQELTQAREQMVQDMLDNAAAWRALWADRKGEAVFVDTQHQRLLWLVPHFGYACMQINPHSGRPLVLNTAGFTREQLAEARVVFNLCHGRAKRDLKPMAWGDYCELAA
jgi:hypothetical protein